MVRSDVKILVIVVCEIYRSAIVSDINYEVSTNLIVPNRVSNVIVEKTNRSIIGDVLPDIMQRRGCNILRVDSEHAGLHLSH